MNLNEDHHIHSTFSDGQDDPETMVQVALDRGLTHLGFADHVRADSDWLGAYVDRLTNLRGRGVGITIGVEAKMLNVYGDLDLPSDLSGVERVLIADHQVPFGDRLLNPREVKELLATDDLNEQMVLRDIVVATARAVLNCPVSPLVAHLFSVLPKAGLAEPKDLSLLQPLVQACKSTNAVVEVDERWRAPSLRVTRYLYANGVHIVASTDSHKWRTLGDYTYVRAVSNALGSNLEHPGNQCSNREVLRGFYR